MLIRFVSNIYVVTVLVAMLGFGSTSSVKAMDKSLSAILEMADLIESNYVIQNVAVNVANKLRSDIKSGKYSKYSNNPQKLAELISENIKRYSNDNHFYVEYINGQNEESNWIEKWLEKAPSKNFGIRKIEILKGNVGYLALSTFYPLEIAKPSIKAAMNLLQHTQGMILDLRHNGGGDDSSASAFLKTFLPKDVEPPLQIESRQSVELVFLPNKLEWERYSESKKLVILINHRTFSAPEALAFSLQEVGRAVIVGSKSAGGAHMTDNPLKVSGGYEIGIPNKRPVSKFSGKNWEGIGVVPNIKSEDESAINIALEQFKN